MQRIGTTTFTTDVRNASFHLPLTPSTSCGAFSSQTTSSDSQACNTAARICPGSALSHGDVVIVPVVVTMNKFETRPSSSSQSVVVVIIVVAVVVVVVVVLVLVFVLVGC